jgi:hypothetical protein
MRAMYTEATMFRRLAEKTRTGELRWDAVRTVQEGASEPQRRLVLRHEGMTVELERVRMKDEEEEWRDYMVWWELFQEEHLFPGNGRVFLDPRAEVAFLELWELAAAGVDWSHVAFEHGEPVKALGRHTLQVRLVPHERNGFSSQARLR